MGTSLQPAGNYYDKYHTRNPVAQLLMQGFLRAFSQLAGTLPAGEAVELGCGEGELSIRLAQAGWRVHGYDIAEKALDEARRRAHAARVGIPFAQLDIREARERIPPGDLVVCCEVLEHLDDPRETLEILCGLSRGHLLISVPREPLWRIMNMARGRYLGELGNTPGHVQHWSRRSLLGMLENQLDLVAVRSPLPWTLALCRKRHG